MSTTPQPLTEFFLGALLNRQPSKLSPNRDTSSGPQLHSAGSARCSRRAPRPWLAEFFCDSSNVSHPKSAPPLVVACVPGWWCAEGVSCSELPEILLGGGRKRELSTRLENGAAQRRPDELLKMKDPDPVFRQADAQRHHDGHHAVPRRRRQRRARRERTAVDVAGPGPWTVGRRRAASARRSRRRRGSTFTPTCSTRAAGRPRRPLGDGPVGRTRARRAGDGDGKRWSCGTRSARMFVGVALWRGCRSAPHPDQRRQWFGSLCALCLCFGFVFVFVVSVLSVLCVSGGGRGWLLQIAGKIHKKVGSPRHFAYQKTWAVHVGISRNILDHDVNGRNFFYP